MAACTQCGAAYAEGQRFCGDCGTALTSDARLTRLVDERLDARLKDQRLVEVETAQAVAARVSEWAKLFGFFVAIPLGILVVILTVLGFRQYSDFVETVESSKDDLSRQLEAIKTEFAAAADAGKSARSEGARLNEELAEIRKTVDLTQAAKLRNELEQLTARVSGIENRFKINNAGLSSAVEQSLTTSLSRFADYMEAVGFPAKQAAATVSVDRTGQVSGNTYYRLEDRTVVVDSALTSLADHSIVLWPYAQHLLQLANKTAIASSRPVALALGNGIPDYFVASHLNEPRIGRGFPNARRGFLRNADNELQFVPTVTAPHDVGEIWAGAFWKIRQATNQRTADRIVFTFWRSLRDADLTDNSGAAAARQLLAAARGIDGGTHAPTVDAILRARKLPVDGR